MSDRPFDLRKHVRETMRKNYYACQGKESDREHVYRKALEKIANSDIDKATDDLILTALDALIAGAAA